MSEQQISVKKHEGYRDTTPFLAVRSIARREVEVVKPGSIYKYHRVNGGDCEVLVLARNEKSATIVMTRTDDDYGAVEIHPGVFAAVGLMNYAWISNLGEKVLDLTAAEFGNVRNMIAAYLQIAPVVTGALTPMQPESRVYTGKAGTFEQITQKMVRLYDAKNHDYGDVFADMRAEFPETGLIYMMVKLSRLKTLMKGEPAKVGESIEDTLMDLANYAIMELVERKYD